jgi:hypothetical protein
MSETAQKWIDALRSDEYKQGYGTLRQVNEDGSYCHCVAGVLADIIDPKGWTSTPSYGEYYFGPSRISFELPLVYWHDALFGVDKATACKNDIDYDILNKAMMMNDDEKFDFNRSPITSRTLCRQETSASPRHVDPEAIFEGPFLNCECNKS